MTKVWRQKLSSRGYTYSVLEDEFVPRIPDDYLDCVIYLYHSRSDAESTAIHCGGGSGFLVGIPSVHEGSSPFLYAVSNRHVVKKAKAIRLNSKEGQTDIVEVEPNDWIFTDDNDVAIYPIKLSDQHNFKWVPAERFLKKEEIRRVGIGDEVFMVGRFVNHEGKQRNTPSARFGNLAMMPSEPVAHPSNVSKEQISFLADIRTVGGFSGSPVFVFDVFNPSSDLYNTGHHASTPLLLGIEWGYLNDHDKNNTGMSGVVPAWFLIDLLNTPALVDNRQNEEAKIARERAKGGTTLT
jgi:hypothetical protein